jgi:hypothetical protein
MARQFKKDIFLKKRFRSLKKKAKKDLKKRFLQIYLATPARAPTTKIVSFHFTDISSSQF